MTEPYVYTDPGGDRLQISPSRSGAGASLLAVDTDDGERVCIVVLPDAVPDVVVATYRAAGLSEPLILKMPQDGDYGRRANSGWGMFSIEGRSVQLETCCLSCNRLSQWKMPPSAVRNVAAVIVQMADRAENEPDPEQVKVIASVIADGDPDLRGGYSDEAPEDIARALLRRFTVTEREAADV